MRTVIFTEDFATKKKGESLTCDGQLASTLVNHDKVAKYADEKPAASKEQTEEKPKKETKKAAK
jgi:hypothetical protein